MALKDESCTACGADAAQVSESEQQTLLAQLPQWQLVNEEGEPRLLRAFEFPDFKAALDFTNRVGELAEQHDHHPQLTTEYGKVRVRWWTHSIGGLHRNDFVLAAQTDGLLEGE
ncbi:MAG: 4a-hydroxytetrahydrobiopterin dehydratase [Pseudomonadota bacterium]|nr:4a-hydroxytetrahydrobiopterin dehydratase [Pseudomonadota bacterium]